MQASGSEAGQHSRQQSWLCFSAFLLPSLFVLAPPGSRFGTADLLLLRWSRQDGHASIARGRIPDSATVKDVSTALHRFHNWKPPHTHKRLMPGFFRCFASIIHRLPGCQHRDRQPRNAPPVPLQGLVASRWGLGLCSPHMSSCTGGPKRASRCAEPVSTVPEQSFSSLLQMKRGLTFLLPSG